MSVPPAERDGETRWRAHSEKGAATVWLVRHKASSKTCAAALGPRVAPCPHTAVDALPNCSDGPQ